MISRRRFLHSTTTADSVAAKTRAEGQIGWIRTLSGTRRLVEGASRATLQ